MAISRKREQAIVHDYKAGILTIQEIATRFGISKESVIKIARKNGARRREWHRWTDAEDELLRLNYKRIGARGMVKLLPNHRNYQSISSRAKKLGLTTNVGPYGRMRFKVIEGGASDKQA